MIGAAIAAIGAAYLLISRSETAQALLPAPKPEPPAPPQPVVPTAGPLSTPMQKFIAKAWVPASKIAVETGWPRDFILSQSAWESGKAGVPGVSYLTQKYNNLFGIKAGANWSGARSGPLWTWEDTAKGPKKVQAYFRAYPDWEASMRDWVSFLQAPRYATVRQALAEGNVQGAFVALKEAGYATDKSYDQRLASVYQQVRSIAV